MFVFFYCFISIIKCKCLYGEVGRENLSTVFCSALAVHYKNCSRQLNFNVIFTLPFLCCIQVEKTRTGFIFPLFELGYLVGILFLGSYIDSLFQFKSLTQAENLIVFFNKAVFRPNQKIVENTRNKYIVWDQTKKLQPFLA